MRKLLAILIALTSTSVFLLIVGYEKYKVRGIQVYKDMFLALIVTLCFVFCMFWAMKLFLTKK